MEQEREERWRGEMQMTFKLADSRAAILADSIAVIDAGRAPEE